MWAKGQIMHRSYKKIMYYTNQPKEVFIKIYQLVTVLKVLLVYFNFV